MKKNLFIAAGALALLTSCGGPKTGITKGSLSEFDSLSYAMGVNIGNSLTQQLRDIPMDIDVVADAVETGALHKSNKELKEASDYIMNFMSKIRPERKKAVMEQRKVEDSTRLANGDTTKMIRPEADPAMFENDAERKEFCEKLGFNMGGGLKQSNLDIQTVWVGEAIRNVWNKEEVKMTPQEAGEYLRYYFMEKLPKMNAEKSEKWLAEKASQSKAVKTESGLVYKVVEEGDLSQTVKSDRDTMKLHFVGRSMNGKVFGASHFADLDEQAQEMVKMYNPDHFDEDKPIEVTCKDVFPGWAEAMKFVGKGGKIRMWIPSNLAFGEYGNRREVGPNEAIEVEAELVDLVPYDYENSPECLNAKASKEWMAEIEKQDGVQKTESGLLYKVERKGNDKVRATKDTDRVRVHYEGTLRSGKVFDSSYERKEPITFGLNQVIKGWTEGMKLIGKGGKITLWIPSELAYGERGAGSDIGPNEALKFTVELLDVNPGK